MAIGRSELQILITAKDQASGALGNLRKGLNLAGVAALAAAGASVKMASDFDKGMREVATLTPDVAKNLDAIKQDVLDLSKSLGIDAVEATGALYQAISAGVPTDNAISFLEIASKAAIGGVTDTETAVDGLTTVMNSFASQNIGAQEAADIMFTTVKAGKTTFEELSRSLFQVAPLADATGVKFAEIAAAMATLTAQGVPTSVATTQLRGSIQSLIKPSDDLTAIFQEAGFETGELAVKQLGFVKASEVVVKATEGSVSEMTKLLGSIEGVQGILGVTGASAEVFAKNVQGMADAGGAAEAAFQEMEKSTSRQFEKMTNKMKALSIELGMKLLPVINKLLVFVTNMHPVFEAAALAVLGVTAALGLMSIALPPLIKSVGLLSKALKLMWIRALAPVVAAIAGLSAPVLIVIGVVAALAAGIGFLGAKFGWFNGILDWAGKFFGGVTEKLGDFVSALGFGAIALDENRDALTRLTLDQRDQLRATEDLEGATSSYTQIVRINSNELKGASDTLQAVRLSAIEPMGDSVGMLENGYLTLTDRMFMAEKEAKRFADAADRNTRALAAANKMISEMTDGTLFLTKSFELLNRSTVPKLNARLEDLRRALEAAGHAGLELEGIVNDVRRQMTGLEISLEGGLEVWHQVESTTKEVTRRTDALARSVAKLESEEDRLIRTQEGVVAAMQNVGFEGEALDAAMAILAENQIPRARTEMERLTDAINAWAGDSTEAAHRVNSAMQKLYDDNRRRAEKDQQMKDAQRAIEEAQRQSDEIKSKELQARIRVERQEATSDRLTAPLVPITAAISTLADRVARNVRYGGMKIRTSEDLEKQAHVQLAAASQAQLVQFMRGTSPFLFGTGVRASGFQRGGAFTVPGSGGPDSQPVSFMATPGERVSVTRPGMGGATHQTIIVQGSLISERDLENLAIRAMRNATRLNESVLNVNAVVA